MLQRSFFDLHWLPVKFRIEFKILLIDNVAIACKNSRLSSLPARVAFREDVHATLSGSEEGRLFSQANVARVGFVYFFMDWMLVHGRVTAFSVLFFCGIY